MSTVDVMLTCRDCGDSFIFSDDERQTFAALGRYNAPSRCAACRTARKTHQVESGTAGVPPRFRERDEIRTTINCSACGQVAVVPFAPRPGRGAYCFACLRRRRIEGDN